MTTTNAHLTRPTLRHRLADRAVARAFKLHGASQTYQRLAAAVPMRDGATLTADVYLPMQPRATVLIRSPYGRGFPLDLLHARVFARHGYQVVVQSVRGRTGSAGEFQPVINEATDGQDTVSWLREQDWYTGKLATFGGSYLGLAQWLLLAQPPEDCGAAVIVVGPHDFARAMWGTGAFALHDMFGWSQAMTATEGGGPLRQAAQMRGMRKRADAATGQLPVGDACQAALSDGAAWFSDWISHDDLTDAFWDPYRATDALKNSEVPTLLLTGWQDAFLDQTLEQYDALRTRDIDVALTIGPWTHMQTATKAAGHVTREALEWFDHCFADQLRDDRIRAIVTGADEWRTPDEWPPAAVPLEFHLQTGQLTTAAADSGHTTFVFDPLSPTPALGGRSTDPTGAGAKDNRPLTRRNDVVTFTGAPASEAIEICGTAELHLRLSADNPHCDVFARLCDVDAKGSAVNIADAFLRLDPSIPAGQEQDVQLIFDPCWHRVRPGHRLQLVLTGGAHPRFARNLGTPSALADGSTVAVQPRTIHHQGTTLRLPVGNPA